MHRVDRQLISGVVLVHLHYNVDERGHLVELMNISPRFHDETTMPLVHSYLTMTRPGIVKAWHLHHQQYDRITVIQGTCKLALHDTRSNMKQLNNELILSPLDNYMVFIPPMVAHGWMNVGNEDLLIINFPTKMYNHAQPDEVRYAFNEQAFEYEWDVRNK